MFFELKVLLTYILICLCSNMGFSQWTQVGNDIDGEASSDQSGISVSLSSNGDRIAIGAKGNNGTGFFSGHVRVYELMEGNWVQLGQDINGENEFDQFGSSVSLSGDGNRVAIGGPFSDDGGYVQLYELTEGAWIQLGNDIDSVDENDWFGETVSLSSNGSRVAVGARLSDEGGILSGNVRVYELQSGIWTQIGSSIDGAAPFDQLSKASLSCDGNRIAVGAPANDEGGPNAGHVRVYEFFAGNWVQLGENILGETRSDQFGISVSLSCNGEIVAIGGDQNDGSANDAGHVRVFEFTEGSWTQLGSDIDGEAAGDNSGFSLSLTSEGNKIIIGAKRNDGRGFSSGHARIYELIQDTWTQLGDDIDGEAMRDESGTSVSFSSFGNRVAIGAPLNSDGGSGAGHVRVFGMCPDLSISAPQVVVVSESTCFIFGGTPTGGVLEVPTTDCPAGSTLKYSLDEDTYSTSLPQYDQDSSIMVFTRCDCDEGADMSPTSVVSTMPGMCPMCPDLSAVTPSLPIVTESTCNMIMGMPMGGMLEPPTDTGCPAGSTSQYSVDGIVFSPMLPTYDQINPITLTTKCVCDNDNNTFSDISTVTTMPGECPRQLTFNSVNTLMFADPCSCVDPRNCLDGGVAYFHDTLIVTAGGATGLTIAAAVGAVDFFIDVPCFGAGFTLIPPGTIIPETPAGSGMYKIEFWRPSGAIPVLSVVEGALITPVPSDIFEPVCITEVCFPPVPTMGEWGLICLSLLLLIVGVIGFRKFGPVTSHS